MSDLDDFLTPTLARQLEAEQALINDDSGPRLAMWSTQDPVTVFGAEKSVIGSEEVTQAFHWLASRFSTAPTTASSWWPPAPAGTWPTPSHEGRPAGDPPARRLAQLRQRGAGRRHPGQDRQRTARPRQRPDHPRHLQPRHPRPGRAGGSDRRPAHPRRFRDRFRGVRPAAMLPILLPKRATPPTLGRR